MKKLFFYNFLLNLSIYTVIYLGKSFMFWSLKNPFQWIIDIPTYEPEVRIGILLLIIMWQFIQVLHLKDFVKKESTKPKSIEYE